MATRVLLTVQKGDQSGARFAYRGKESVIVGRQSDCGIVLTESTVSRYHCLIDIAPPSVVVRDFGSLNGTFLNGKKIGQRDEGMSAADARASRGAEFVMKPGDRLGLGCDCELSLEVLPPQYCADCYREIEDVSHQNAERMPVCEDCHRKRAEEERAHQAAQRAEQARAAAQREAEQLAAKERAAADVRARADAERARREAEARAADLKRIEEQEKQRKRALEDERKAEHARKAQADMQRQNRRCEVCGQPVAGGEDAPGICQSCQQDPMKVLMCLLQKANNGAGDAAEIAGYRNIRMLGRGGMGQVWLVEEEKTGRQMALKLMLPKAAADENSRETFLREAHIAGQLEHRNIVRQYKCGQSGDTYFILMELCDGGSVDSLIANSGGRLSIDLATQIMLQVLDGFIYAHRAPLSVTLKRGKTATSNGLVHRDFKPGNIFLSGSGANMTAKTADFGLAKAFETSGLSGHTRTGQLAGTPVFMPRQQIINYKFAKPPVDIWAAAASYYQMLTGAFTKDFVQGKDVIATALSASAVPIRKRDRAIPKRLAEVIDHALLEKPDIGVQSAAELKSMIEGAL